MACVLGESCPRRYPCFASSAGLPLDATLAYRAVVSAAFLRLLFALNASNPVSTLFIIASYPRGVWTAVVQPFWSIAHALVSSQRCCTQSFSIFPTCLWWLLVHSSSPNCRYFGTRSGSTCAANTLYLFVSSTSLRRFLHTPLSPACRSSSSVPTLLSFSSSSSMPASRSKCCLGAIISCK